MVSLAGSSEAYPALDDGGVRLGRGADTRVIVAHDQIMYGDSSALGTHNILIGKHIEAGPKTKNNIVLSEDVKLLGDVANVISIGRRDRAIERSNFTEIGDFLYHDGETGKLKLLKDAIVATQGGDVLIGGEDGLIVRRGQQPDGTLPGTELVAPMRLTERGVCGWTFGLTAAENAEGAEQAGAMRDLVLKSDNGASIVFSDLFVPAVTNFTGQHRCMLRSHDDSEPPIGTVMVATGDYCGFDNQELSVDEAVPIVIVSQRKRDVRVFGVLSSLESVGTTRRIRIGNIAFDRPKDANERRVVVNGSGEGGILVCSEGGDIENGDYLCTSSRPGLAMKQDEPFKCPFTCGKATTAVQFDDECLSSKMIGCVYA